MEKKFQRPDGDSCRRRKANWQIHDCRRVRQKLFYHSFKKENSTRNYEIDFLLTDKNKVCPIEVKSSGYKVHNSIDAFAKKFSSRISKKYLLYTKDLKKEGDIIYLPFYLAQFLR